MKNILFIVVSLLFLKASGQNTNEEFDGIFISNGPGDPKHCKKTIRILQKALLNLSRTSQAKHKVRSN